MITCKKEAIQIILKSEGKFVQGRKSWENVVQYLQSEGSETGFTREEVDKLINFCTSVKLNSTYVLKIFNFLIPCETISDESVTKVLQWIFEEKLTFCVQKKLIKWMTGLTYYQLVNTNIVDLYYFSFIELIRNQISLVSHVCPLLGLLTKPEDVMRWVVKILLKIHSKARNKSQITALLSLMKSYRPDIVPENIDETAFNYQQSVYNESMSKFSTSDEQCERGDDKICWNLPKLYDNKSKSLGRLIPKLELIDTSSNVSIVKKVSLTQFLTMLSIAKHGLNISLPAQTLSLLANDCGFHVIAFGDAVLQSRFENVLYRTLYKVFIQNSEPYTENEKKFFLMQVYQLEEYMQQGIAVVSKFLNVYLSMWDTHSFQHEILALCEWNLFLHEDIVLSVIKQAYRSNGVKFKRKLLSMLTAFVCNMSTVLTRRAMSVSCIFLQDTNEMDAPLIVRQTSDLVSYLLIEGCNYSDNAECQCLLYDGFDYFQTVWELEQKFNLPYFCIIPSVLVYKSLFSTSKVLISRLCCQLNRYQETIERLTDSGLINNCEEELMKLDIFVMDCYKCLFLPSDVYNQGKSFLFQDERIMHSVLKFQDIFGKTDGRPIMNIQNHVAFVDCKTVNSELVGNKHIDHILDEFPHIKEFKTFVDNKIFNGNSSPPI